VALSLTLHSFRVSNTPCHQMNQLQAEQETLVDTIIEGVLSRPDKSTRPMILNEVLGNPGFSPYHEDAIVQRIEQVGAIIY
jgi:hypothetical protein